MATAHYKTPFVALFLLTILITTQINAQTTGFAEVAGGVFNVTCVNCHSSDKFSSARNGAPFNVNFDTFSWAVLNAERGNIRIQAGTMPPTGERSSSEKAILQSWVDQGTPVGEVIGYEDMRTNIFEETCLNCHSSEKSGSDRNGAPSSVNFDIYPRAVANADRGNIRVQEGSMPPGDERSDEQKSMFQNWINLNTPFGDMVTYDQISENLFEPVCLNCHDSNKSGLDRSFAPENVNFDTYDFAVTSAYAGNNQVQDGFMPPQGDLTLEQKAMFLDWVYSDLAEGSVETTVKCDFNGDGQIVISDVIALLLYQRSNAGDLLTDFNGNGEANVSDAIALLIAIRDGTCPDAN